MTAALARSRNDWLSWLRTIMVLRPGQRHLAIPGAGVAVGSGRATLHAGGPANGLLTGLVGYWKLDETTGNRADATGNGHTAVPTNTPGYATGKISNAVDLERDSGQYLTVADDAALQFGTGSFSISLWIYPETTNYTGSFQGTILSKNYTGFELMFYLSQLYGYIGGASNSLNGSASLSPGSWYHLCFVRDGSACKIYINNGAADSSATNSADVSNAGTDMNIGRRTGSANTEYDGLVDEVGIWSRVLSADDRTALYNAGAGLAYGSFTA